MIDASNVFEVLALHRFWLWHSPNSDKWVLFEAQPEEGNNTKRSSSYEDEEEAKEALNRKRQRFIADLKARIECKPTVQSGQEQSKESSTSTTKSFSLKTKKKRKTSSERASYETLRPTTELPPKQGSATSQPF